MSAHPFAQVDVAFSSGGCPTSRGVERTCAAPPIGTVASSGPTKPPRTPTIRLLPDEQPPSHERHRAGRGVGPPDEPNVRSGGTADERVLRGPVRLACAPAPEHFCTATRKRRTRPIADNAAAGSPVDRDSIAGPPTGQSTADHLVNRFDSTVPTAPRLKPAKPVLTSCATTPCSAQGRHHAAQDFVEILKAVAQ